MMQTSSPLAALQPSAFHNPWQRRNDHHSDLNNFLRPRSYEAKSFNFRDMSMAKPTSDYFSCKPVRGSSPTSTLAVDLSQNFHIDQSPQVPTPRRSLFTSNLLASSRPDVVTPPIPSSSPGPINDGMDTSPLPHKPARAPVIQQPLCSPSPDPTPVEITPVPAELPRIHSQPVLATSPKQRKVFNAARPSLKKGYSSNGIPARPRTSSASQPAFLFGSSYLPCRPTLETFAESPPSERRLPPSASQTSLLGVAESPLAQTGSPLAGPRRPSLCRNQSARSGLSRRTQSVQYANPNRPVRAEKRCCTTGSFQPSLYLEDAHQPKLPNFRSADDPDGLPRIDKETFVSVMNGDYSTQVGDTLVIDCRFEYEYEGGHIEGAVNFNDKEELARQLFETDALSNKSLILHCEYSAHRAPMAAKYIRERDREHNRDQYPRLSYPEMYILDGGYSDFFKCHPSRCFPQSYVEMDAKEHENACERGMAKVKRRGKLSRAQTYAFGQSLPRRDDAPPPLVPSLSTGFACKSFSSVMTISPLNDSMDIDIPTPSTIKMDHPRVPPPRRFDSY